MKKNHSFFLSLFCSVMLASAGTAGEPSLIQTVGRGLQLHASVIRGAGWRASETTVPAAPASLRPDGIGQVSYGRPDALDPLARHVMLTGTRVKLWKPLVDYWKLPDAPETLFAREALIKDGERIVWSVLVREYTGKDGKWAYDVIFIRPKYDRSGKEVGFDYFLTSETGKLRGAIDYDRGSPPRDMDGAKAAAEFPKARRAFAGWLEEQTRAAAGL